MYHIPLLSNICNKHMNTVITYFIHDLITDIFLFALLWHLVATLAFSLLRTKCFCFSDLFSYDLAYNQLVIFIALSLILFQLTCGVQNLIES